MEWLGLLLLYAISGYMKKRQQNEKRRQIENSPDWDPDVDKRDNDQPTNFNQLFNDLFESNPKTPKAITSIKDILFEENINSEEESFIKDEDDLIPQIRDEQENLPEIDEKNKKFKDNIYHSELAKKEELHFGKKWDKQKNLRLTLFKSKSALKKAIVVKEILDKPLSLRK